MCSAHTDTLPAPLCHTHTRADIGDCYLLSTGREFSANYSVLLDLPWLAAYGERTAPHHTAPLSCIIIPHRCEQGGTLLGKSLPALHACCAALPCAPLRYAKLQPCAALCRPHPSLAAVPLSRCPVGPQAAAMQALTQTPPAAAAPLQPAATRPSSATATAALARGLAATCACVACPVWRRKRSWWRRWRSLAPWKGVPVPLGRAGCTSRKRRQRQRRWQR